MHVSREYDNNKFFRATVVSSNNLLFVSICIICDKSIRFVFKYETKIVESFKLELIVIEKFSQLDCLKYISVINFKDSFIYRDVINRGLEF